MGERRMVSRSVIRTDQFLDMPLSAQALYVHLNLDADDDGFVANPNTIRRMIGASADDMKILMAKKFVLAFDNGVVVIRHWRQMNTLQNDRYKQTVFKDQYKALKLHDDKIYYPEGPDSGLIRDCFQTDSNLDTDCFHSGSSSEPQLNLTEHNITQHNSTQPKEPGTKNKKRSGAVAPVVDDPDLNQALLDFAEHRKNLKKPLTDKGMSLLLKRLEKLAPDNRTRIRILEQSMLQGWQGVFPLDENGASGKGKDRYQPVMEFGESAMNGGVPDDFYMQ
ncbi:MAG: hypothetical protein IJT43_11830 [Stomatobaculum sp.]|nr:hypothetical protein [Stomatobaculum sp.]